MTAQNNVISTARRSRVLVTGDKTTSIRVLDTVSSAESKVRATLSGISLPLALAIACMTFLASDVFRRTRYHLGDSETKGRTARTKKMEGREVIT